MNAKIRKMNVRNRTDMELIDIAKWLNPILQGWINYYGKFYKTALMPVLEHVNETLVKWALRKYDNLKYKHRWSKSGKKHMNDETPRLRMFAGPNGSGKSTFKSIICPELLGGFYQSWCPHGLKKLWGKNS